MRLILDNNHLNEPVESLLRQAGYVYLIDRNTGKESFVHSLNRGYYPRFHLYLEQQNNKTILNLHLDQKQASYQGAYAHNAEYDGEIIEREMARLKNFAVSNSENVTYNAKASDSGQDILDKIRPKQFDAPAKSEEKKSWWGKLFN